MFLFWTKANLKTVCFVIFLVITIIYVEYKKFGYYMEEAQPCLEFGPKSQNYN